MTDFSLSVCVFCGSRAGNTPAVARATQQAGGVTFGAIPVHLFRKEVAKADLSTYVVTENMHERKKIMFMNCDAIVVLPGGAGSLDEFFEVLTWKQIGLHSKPIYLLSVNDYWKPLEGLIDHVIDHGFADEINKTYFKTVQTVDELTAELRGLQNS